MCNADTGLMAFYWVKGYERPYPNWNTWHMCPNYDDILAWTDENRVEMPLRWEDWRPPGVYEFDGPPEPQDHPMPNRSKLNV